MFMKTLRRPLLSYAMAVSFAASSLLLSGCSQPASKQEELERASNLFFESVNHLFENDAVSFDGELSIMGMQVPYTAAIISDPAEIALSAGSEQGSPLVAFYLKEGKTYLDYMGVKTSSVAENIGLPANGKLTLTNPFNELSREDRLALFDAVEIKGDIYTFTINPAELAKTLDSFGAVSIERATLSASIEDANLESLSLDLKGTYDIDTASSSLNFTGSLNVCETGNDVTIVYPDDLDTYTAE